MSPQQLQGRALVGGRGAKALEAPGISHFLVAENGLKYQKILQFTVLQKRPKCISNPVCHSALFYNCLFKKKD